MLHVLSLVQTKTHKFQLVENKKKKKINILSLCLILMESLYTRNNPSALAINCH